LRSGVDSLYLSIWGVLKPQVLEELDSLKLAAQSEIPIVRASAVYPVGEHRFEVAARGRKGFPFILQDNLFRLEISRSGGSYPLVYAQIRSQILTLEGFVAAHRELEELLKTFCNLSSPCTISRVDLCADFLTNENLSEVDREHFIGRARKLETYWDGLVFSGYVIGAGGDVSARIYNKTLEISESRKRWMLPLWAGHGESLDDSVWRLEFQFRQAALRELSVESFNDLEAHTAALWNYATESWLRIAVPNPSEKTRSRWKIASFWKVLAQDGFSEDFVPIGRKASSTRVPSDERIFVHGFTGISSYMAREGIDEVSEAIVPFFNALEKYHQERTGSTSGFGGYTKLKAHEKFRRFNTSLAPTLESGGD